MKQFENSQNPLHNDWILMQEYCSWSARAWFFRCKNPLELFKWKLLPLSRLGERCMQKCSLDCFCWVSLLKQDVMNRFLARTCLTTLWQITKLRIAPNFIVPATKRRILATAFEWRLPLYHRASLRDPWPCVRLLRLAWLTAHWKLTTFRIECFSLLRLPVVSRKRQFPPLPRSQRCTLRSRYSHNFQQAVKACCILLFLASI